MLASKKKHIELVKLHEKTKIQKIALSHYDTTVLVEKGLVRLLEVTFLRKEFKSVGGPFYPDGNHLKLRAPGI